MAQVQRQRSGDSRGQPLLYNTSALCTSWLVSVIILPVVVVLIATLVLVMLLASTVLLSYGCSEGDDDDGIEHDVGDGELITIVFAAAGSGSVGEDKRMPITAAGNDE